jgi:uncharacterized membrane protein YphA (DoxX/SURF4 family)
VSAIWSFQGSQAKNIAHGRRYIGRLVFHPYFTLFVRVAVGGVLIFAGILKLPHINTLIWEIGQYRILPGSLAEIYGYALPPLELILGSFLLLGLWIRISAALSGLLMLSFTIAKIAAFIRGLNIDICPCFGPAVPLLALPSLAINIVLMVMVFQLLLHRGEFLSIDALFSAKADSIDK